MKKIFICLLFSTVYLSFALSQEVKLKSIPYLMSFENAAESYTITSDNSITITAGNNTDLFISPDGWYEINKSPRLIFKPDSDFIFSAKINLDFKSKWDAGVLIIYNDSKHFAKFCFELDYKFKPRVVSVVCNDVADDCNAMTVEKNEVYYRIIGSTKGDTFKFYYSTDGNNWLKIRDFKLTKADNLRIGLSSQSPIGKGCTVDFSEISLKQQKPVDEWLGE